MYYFYIVFINYLHTSIHLKCQKNHDRHVHQMAHTFSFKVGVRTTISIKFFIAISNYIISVQFVEIKYAEDDHTLQTINTEFEK